MNDGTATTTADPAALKAAEEAAKIEAKKQEAAKKAEAKKLADEAKAQAKIDKKAKSDADKAAKVQAKIDAKRAAEDAKASSQMPMKNDVRRPKPGTVTGKCWEVYDDMSNKRGSPVAIADAKAVLEAQGVNEATIRTQYAHWRKFNDVSGRIDAVAKPVEAAPAAPPPPMPEAAKTE